MPPQAHIAYQNVQVFNLPDHDLNMSPDYLVWGGDDPNAHSHSPVENEMNTLMHEKGCHDPGCHDLRWPKDGEMAGMACGGGSVKEGRAVPVKQVGCEGNWHGFAFAGLLAPYNIKEPTDGSLPLVKMAKAPGNWWTVTENEDVVARLGHPTGEFGQAWFKDAGSQCTPRSWSHVTGDKPEDWQGNPPIQGGSPTYNQRARLNTLTPEGLLMGARDIAAYDSPVTTTCYSQLTLDKWE